MKSFDVSVVVLTYCHEKYIAQTLNGIFSQLAKFKVEVLICDDASMDNTNGEIENAIRGYQGPFTVKSIRHPLNLGSKENGIYALRNCQGKYIAFCEGDDYWTDPYKLQKQVDLMSKYPDLSLCAHNFDTIEDGNKLSERHCIKESNSSNAFEEITKTMLIQGNPLGTLSVLLRRDVIEDIPDWFKKSPFGDYALYFLAASKGRLFRIPKCMGVYRKHAGGVHSPLHNEPKGLIKIWERHILFYKLIRKNIKKSFTLNQDYMLYESVLKSYQNAIEVAKKEHYTYKYIILSFRLIFYKLIERINNYIKNW
jgi:glycosyltransferase involved in cell wall biosynthesis